MRYISSSIILYLLLTPAFAQRVITTVAGTDWLFPGDGRPAIDAPLGGALQGLDVAVDRKGNYYICDGDNLMVMRVGPDGLINVIAGNGVNFASGDAGPAVNAGLLFPIAIALDSVGNLYIAEGDQIRKVSLDGIITTIAGTGDSGFSGDNGPAIQAQLYGPSGLAVDSGGNLYVADTYNNRIRKIAPDGTITTIAGTGEPSFSGDNGPATSAQLNFPGRIALDSAGNLYIADSLNSRVRKVDVRGIITTVAGGGADHRDGVQATSAFLIPVAITFDTAGVMYIADFSSAGIRKVDTQGRITTIAGGSTKAGLAGDGGPALNARFSFSLRTALAVDPGGAILVADDGNQRIRKINPDGVITTIAGNGLFRFSGNGGPATSAALDNPTGVVADAAGNIFITEPPLSRIRRISADGSIDVFAGNGVSGYSGDNGPALSASLSLPSYLTFDPGGNLYVSDFGVVRRIDSNGIITTFAGTGDLGAAGDGGPATAAKFRLPQGIDFDSAGELIIADNQDNRIRVVIPDGGARPSFCVASGTCVITIAGNGVAGFSGDDGPAPRAQVNGPTGVRVYNKGIYFADSGNNRIRKIDIATLIITTVAGNGQAAYSGDGGPAVQASLSAPQSLNFDAAGNMYIADTRNSVVRLVTPDGTISTFVGVAKKFIQGDGGPTSAAGVAGPSDIFVDSTGRILIADFFLDRIRAVLTTLPTIQVNPANLAFTAPAGSTPATQRLELVGSIPGVPFSASATATSSGWLQVSPGSGAMPASVVVTADPSVLSPGGYQGTVTITSPNAQPSTNTIPVSLTVTGAGQPSLDLKPTSLTFSFVQQSPASSRSVSVSNIGGGSLAFTAVTTTTPGGSWLTASRANATVGAFASTPVTIAADPSRLGPGTYSGTVTFSSVTPAQSVVVPVTMTVTAVQQTILIPQSGLTFFTVQGGGPALPQFFSILNTGVGQMPFSVRASTLSGGSWLSVFPANGVSDASSPVVPQVRVDANPQDLDTGTYYGSVQVTAPGAGNNPQFVSIILNVLPPGSNIGPVVQPSALIFAAAAGAEPPGSQTIVVQNTSSTPVTFHSGRITADGTNWFTSLPPDGTVTQGQPVRIVIQPRTAGLAPAIYRGTLTLSFSDGNTRNIALVLVIIPSGSRLPASKSFRDAQSACKPTALAPVLTLLSDGFRIFAGYPGQVAVKVIDDCANPMTSGDVTVGFSNGDPPIRLISLKDGTWAATWTPERITPQITVTASAEIPEQNLKGQVQIKGGVQASEAPVIGTGAVLNAASLSPQTPLAPGSIIAVLGSKLAQGQDSATGTLPTSLAGSSVVLAGQSVPLLFASDARLNAVIPYGVAVNTTQQVVVLRGSSLSVPRAVTLAPAAPGIFTKDGTGQGQGMVSAVGADGTQTLADAAHPVKAGDNIVIYCTGLGEVEPPVPTGTPAPATPPSKTVNAATVTIGGVTASVGFSGLVPGSAGMYQVTTVVPPGVPTGDQIPIVVTVAGQPSQPVTIAIR